MARSYHRALLPQVLDDLRAIAEFDDTLVDAALQAIADLAEHRKTGKLLGLRHVSGDLTGCRRLRFDLPGERPSGSGSSTGSCPTTNAVTSRSSPSVPAAATPLTRLPSPRLTSDCHHAVTTEMSAGISAGEAVGGGGLCCTLRSLCNPRSATV